MIIQQNEGSPTGQPPAPPVLDTSFLDAPDDSILDDDHAEWAKARPDRKPTPLEVLKNAVGFVPILFPWWIRLLLVLVLGMGLGAFLMRQRHASNDVVLTVGKDRITGEEFYHRLEVASGPEVLSKLEREKLMIQFAKRQHAFPTEEEVRKRTEEMMLQPEVAEQMTNHHMTPDDVQYQSVLQLATEALLSKDVPVSDQEAQEYYKQQSDPANPHSKFIVPESVRIQVVSALQEATIRKAYQALLDGEIFASVAEKYSMDRSAVNGGFGPVMWRGNSQLTATPGFEEAVFRLNKDERLGPKKFGNAWWIVRCDGHFLGRTLPYERVKDVCKSDVRLLKGQRTKGGQLEEEFVAFRKTVPVTLFWDRFYFDIKDQATKLTPESEGKVEKPADPPIPPPDVGSTGGD